MSFSVYIKERRKEKEERGKGKSRGMGKKVKKKGERKKSSSRESKPVHMCDIHVHMTQYIIVRIPLVKFLID